MSLSAVKRPLRGADPRHQATTKSLQKKLPELLLLGFDTRLIDAASAEEMLPNKSFTKSPCELMRLRRINRKRLQHSKRKSYLIASVARSFLHL
jgi:hypothetical protein